MALPRTEGRKERLFLGVLRAPASRTVAKARRRQACVLVQSQGSAARRLLSEDRGTPRPPGGGLPGSAPSRRNGAPVIPRSSESSASRAPEPRPPGKARDSQKSASRAPASRSPDPPLRPRPSFPSVHSVRCFPRRPRSQRLLGLHESAPRGVAGAPYRASCLPAPARISFWSPRVLGPIITASPPPTETTPGTGRCPLSSSPWKPPRPAASGGHAPSR